MSGLPSPSLPNPSFPSSSLEPGRWYYGLAALIAVTGMTLSATSMLSGIGGMGEDMQQVVVPGNGDLLLSDIGEYIIFYENQTVVNSRVYSTDQDIPGLLIEIKNKTTGRNVETYLPQGSFSYSIGGRFGRSVMAFYIERPGIYELSAGYPQAGDGPEVVLAVGHDVSGGIVFAVVVPLLIFFGSVSAAVIIAAVTYRRRQDAAKRAKEDERRIRGL